MLIIHESLHNTHKPNLVITTRGCHSTMYKVERGCEGIENWGSEMESIEGRAFVQDYWHTVNFLGWTVHITAVLFLCTLQYMQFQWNNKLHWQCVIGPGAYIHVYSWAYHTEMKGMSIKAWSTFPHQSMSQNSFANVQVLYIMIYYDVISLVHYVSKYFNKSKISHPGHHDRHCCDIF